MSYSITLKVTDGTVAVDSTSGTVPDGTFAVGGHEDADHVSISVQRLKSPGSLVASASTSAGKAAFPVEAAQ